MRTVNIARVHPTRLQISVGRQPLTCFICPAIQKRVSRVERSGLVQVATLAPKTEEQFRSLDHHQRIAKVAVGDAHGCVQRIRRDAVVHWQSTVRAKSCACSDQKHVGRSEGLRVDKIRERTAVAEHGIKERTTAAASSAARVSQSTLPP